MVHKIKTRFAYLGKALYEAECLRLGKPAIEWPNHERDCTAYWAEVIELGELAWGEKYYDKRFKKSNEDEALERKEDVPRSQEPSAQDKAATDQGD